MTLLSLAWKNLTRRLTRSLLSALGIALAVGSAIALTALSAGISSSVEEGVDERGASLVVSQRGKVDIFGGNLAEALGPAIARVPGVAGVTGELLLFTASTEGRHVLVAGWPAEADSWAKVPLASGRLPVAGAREVIVGDTLADNMDLKVGATLDLFEESFTVVGITRYRSVLNRSLATLPLADMQEAAGRPGRVTGFYVRLTPGLDADRRAAVTAGLLAVGPVAVSGTQEVLDADRNVRVLRAVSSAVSLIALITAALNVLNTLLISVQERTREIGVLSALGWSDGLVVRLILIEGAILGLVGCVAGVGLGVLGSLGFSKIPTIGTYIMFHPTAGAILPPLGMALALCVVGSLYPALRAVRLMPAEALRAV